MRRRIGHLLQPQFPFVVIVDAFDFLITSNSDAAVRSDPNIQIFVAVYKFIFQAPRQPRHLIGLVLRKDIKLKFPPKRPDFRQSFCVHSIRRHHDSPLQYLGFPLFRRFRRRLPLLARMGRTGHVMCRRRPDRSHRCWRQRRRHPACQPLLPFQSNEYPNCPSKLRLSPAFSFFSPTQLGCKCVSGPASNFDDSFRVLSRQSFPRATPSQCQVCSTDGSNIQRVVFRPTAYSLRDGRLGWVSGYTVLSLVLLVRACVLEMGTVVGLPPKTCHLVQIFTQDFTSNLIQGSTGT